MFRAEGSVLISTNVESLWDFVSQYENFGRFLSHLHRLTPQADGSAGWELSGPQGVCLSSQVRFVPDEQRRHITWLALNAQGETMQSEGELWLEPRGADTQLTLRLSYKSSDKVAHRVLTELFKDFQITLEGDLETLCEIMETPRRPLSTELVRARAFHL